MQEDNNMPERVTKEERIISLAIEKARSAKEELSLSLNDNNRSPIDDESEAVKVKRPKAENVDVEIKPDGKHNGLGLDSSAYSGEETHFKKADEYLEETLRQRYGSGKRPSNFNEIKDEMMEAIQAISSKHDLKMIHTYSMLTEIISTYD